MKEIFVCVLCILFGASIGVAIKANPKTFSIIEPEKVCSIMPLNKHDLKSSNLLNLQSKTGFSPCREETTSTFSRNTRKYSKLILDKVNLLSQTIKNEVENVPMSEDELKEEESRRRYLKKTTDHFRKYYPRFPIGKSPLGGDQHYYGVHTGDFKDSKRFLGERVCRQPQLSFADSETSYLGLFFSLNNGRHFGGMTSIINEKIVTLIESSLLFSEIEKYFERKIVPTANFRSWVHEDLERDYKGWVYQVQEISQIRYGWESYFFFSPWLYNSCNKSIGTISNFCSLDSSYDMEFKEFFYVTNEDLMLGNIYCKKSSDLTWTRLAITELIRI